MKTLIMIIGAFTAATIIDNLNGLALNIVTGIAVAFIAVTIAAIKRSNK